MLSFYLVQNGSLRNSYIENAMLRIERLTAGMST